MGCPRRSQLQCCSLAGGTSLLDWALMGQAWFSEGHWGQAFPNFCLLSGLLWEAVTEGTPLWTPPRPSCKQGLRSHESEAKINLPPLSCYCQILWPRPRMHPAGVQKAWQTFNIWPAPGSRKTFLWPQLVAQVIQTILEKKRLHNHGAPAGGQGYMWHSPTTLLGLYLPITLHCLYLFYIPVTGKETLPMVENSYKGLPGEPGSPRGKDGRRCWPQNKWKTINSIK